MSRVECLKISVSGNTADAIFRVNVYWMGVFGKLSVSRWRFGCDEHDWSCYPTGNEHVVEENR
jgi:hypothetical protein